MSLSYIELLSEDLTKLLTEGDDNYDVIMTVGQGDDIEEFKIHSSILSVRTPYFENAFSNRWKKIDGDKIKLNKPNIRPKIFKAILRYLYGGTLKLNKLTASDTLDLLVALDELCINNIIEDIQDYLLKNDPDWIDQNFVYFHHVVFQHEEAFTKLQKHWDNAVCREPNLLFFAEDFPDFEESSLIEVLQLDELGIKEVDIWKNIIRWGIAKYPSDSSSDFPSSVSDWTDENFNFLKEVLKNIIPLIRFFTISSEEFYQHIKPYAKLLEAKNYDDILQYHLIEGWKPSVTPVLPKRDIPHKPIESDIINKRQAAIISSWIDKREPKLGFFVSKYYESFVALLAGNKKPNNFYEDVESYMYKPSKNPYDFSNVLDNNINNNYDSKKILTVYKCSNSNKIIGEYKEIDIIMNSYRNSIPLRFGPNTNSFLFSLESNSITNPIISRLKLSKIYQINSSSGSGNKVPNFDKIKFIDYNTDKKRISLIPKNVFDIRNFEIFRGSKSIKVEKAETIRIIKRQN